MLNAIVCLMLESRVYIVHHPPSAGRTRKEVRGSGAELWCRPKNCAGAVLAEQRQPADILEPPSHRRSPDVVQRIG